MLPCDPGPSNAGLPSMPQGRRGQPDVGIFQSALLGSTDPVLTRSEQRRRACAATGALWREITRLDRDCRASSGGTDSSIEAASHGCTRRWRPLIRFAAMYIGDCHGEVDQGAHP